MMNLKTTRLLFGGALAAGLLGCGGPSGEPLTAQNIALVMQGFAVVTQVIPSSNSVPSIQGLGVSTMSNFETMAMDCETITPTPLVDSDTDGIAAKKVSTFDCTNLTTGSTTYTRKGSVTVVDKDDTKKGLAGGVRVDFNVPTFNNTASGTENQYSYVGYWDYSAYGNGFKSVSDFTGTVKYDYGTYKNDYTYNYTWETTAVPVSGTVLWSGNDVNMNFQGTYAVSGKFVNEVNNVRSQATGSYVVKYYSKDLVSAGAGCSKFYRSGSYFIEDGMGTVLEIRFACTSAQLYVNGKASDLFKP